MNWQLPYGAHPLAPFNHQVAGQSSMLCYGDTTVCKPLIKREHSVYKTLPKGLKEFTADYRGIIVTNDSVFRMLCKICQFYLFIKKKKNFMDF